MSNANVSRLPADAQKRKPVYVSRQVAARMAGVHDYTVGTHCEPDAWRRERGGKLIPLYTDETVQAFIATYRDGRKGSEL